MSRSVGTRVHLTMLALRSDHTCPTSRGHRAGACPPGRERERDRLCSASPGVCGLLQYAGTCHGARTPRCHCGWPSLGRGQSCMAGYWGRQVRNSLKLQVNADGGHGGFGSSFTLSLKGDGAQLRSRVHVNPTWHIVGCFLQIPEVSKSSPHPRSRPGPASLLGANARPSEGGPRPSCNNHTSF